MSHLVRSAQSLLAVLALSSLTITQAVQECPPFFDLVAGSFCLHVSTSSYNGSSRPITWGHARDNCRAMAPNAWTSDLVKIPGDEKMAQLGEHILQNYTDMRYYIWWVGADVNSDNTWSWQDGSQVTSSIWLPNHPHLGGSVGQLVPGGSDPYQLMMRSTDYQYTGPSFMCEAWQ